MNTHVSLRSRLLQKAALLGMFSIIPAIEIVEMIGLVGFDAVILDMEHGPYGIQALGPLILAARARGIMPIARVRPKVRCVALLYALAHNLMRTVALMLQWFDHSRRGLHGSPETIQTRRSAPARGAARRMDQPAQEKGLRPSTTISQCSLNSCIQVSQSH